MLYIHQLRDLCPKTADIESVQLLRDIRQKNPSNEQIIQDLMSVLEFNNREIIIDSMNRIAPAIERIKGLISKNDPIYESINLHRAVSMLTEIIDDLKNNIDYFDDINLFRNDIKDKLNNIVSSIRNAKTSEEKYNLNSEINEIFKRILRTDDFTLKYENLVYEKDTARMKDLHESLANGFFFHITVKEHIDRKSFESIKSRIPHEKLVKADEIMNDVLKIKKGVDIAYEFNMSMIKFSIFFYSYIRYMNAS